MTDRGSPVPPAAGYGEGTARMHGDPEASPRVASGSAFRGGPPWAPVAQAVPIPARADQVGAMPAEDFAQLVATNLMPRQDVVGFNRLWSWCQQSDILADRAYDVLEALRDEGSNAIAGGRLLPKERARVKKFLWQVNQAWDRLDAGGSATPLAWAGRAARGFNPASRAVIAQLVDAIDDHRAAAREEGAPPEVRDARLWQVLQQVGLDPAHLRVPRGDRL